MIKITNLHKSFGEQEVLRGIDLAIPDGETIAIIGQSGCGKSVLLKLMLGLMKADEGEIMIDEVSMSKAKERQLELVRLHIGFLFQGAALFDSMTVLENVTLGVKEHGERNPEVLAKIAAEKLDLVGLHGIEQRMPQELSGGMKKRVALARALATNPRYVFYDEPTTGLDPVTSDQIDSLVRDLTTRLRVTSIIVTHDLFTVERIAKRVVFLNKGKIYFDGTPDELYKSTDVAVMQFLSRYRTPVAAAVATS